MIPKHCILFQGSRSRSVKFCFYCHPRPPRWLSGKEPACQCKNEGSILGLGRSPGEGNGNPLQCSCLENPMDGGALPGESHGWRSLAGCSPWGCRRVRHDLATETTEQQSASTYLELSAAPSYFYVLTELRVTITFWKSY